MKLQLVYAMHAKSLLNTGKINTGTIRLRTPAQPHVSSTTMQEFISHARLSPQDVALGLLSNYVHLNLLKQAEDSSNDTHDTSGTGDIEGAGAAVAGRGRGRAGAGAGAGATVASAVWESASALRVRVGTLAGVLALNDTASVMHTIKLVACFTDVAGGLEVECTSNVGKLREGHVGEVAVKVKSTNNGLKLRESNRTKGCVVGDVQTTADLDKLRHGEICLVLVGDEREVTTDVGEVGGGEHVEEVGVKAERAVGSGERGQAHLGAVAESQLVTPLHVGEDGADVQGVGLENHRVRDVTELHSNVVQEVVVGNVDSVGNLEVDAVKAAELSVLDGQALHHLKTGGERQTLQLRQPFPLNLGDIRQSREVERRKERDLVERERVGDDLQCAGRKTGELGNILCLQAAFDFLDAIHVDVSAHTGGDGDAAGEGRARGDGGSVAAVLDGSSCGDTA